MGLFPFNSTAKGGTAGGRDANTKQKPVSLAIVGALLPLRRTTSLWYLPDVLATTSNMLEG